MLFLTNKRFTCRVLGLITLCLITLTISSNSRSFAFEINTECPSNQITYGDSDIRRIYAIDANPDGTIVAAIQAKGIYLYSIDTLLLIDTLACQEFMFGNALDWSPDGNYLATYTQKDSGIEIWRVKDKARIAQLRGEDDPGVFDANGERTGASGVSVVLWSPDGDLLAAIGYGGLPMRVWDVAHQKLVFESDQYEVRDIWNPSPNVLAWSSSGNYLAIAQANLIDILETQTWSLVHELKNEDEINSLSWLDEKYLATGGHYNQLTVWDTQTWELLDLPEEFKIPSYTVSWLPDSSLLAVSGDMGDNSIHILNFADQEISTVLSVAVTHQSNQIQNLQWLSEGKELLSLMSDVPSSTIHLWNVESDRVVAQLDSTNNTTEGNNS